MKPSSLLGFFLHNEGYKLRDQQVYQRQYSCQQYNYHQLIRIFYKQRYTVYCFIA